MNKRKTYLNSFYIGLLLLGISMTLLSCYKTEPRVFPDVKYWATNIQYDYKAKGFEFWKDSSGTNTEIWDSPLLDVTDMRTRIGFNARKTYVFPMSNFSREQAIAATIDSIKNFEYRWLANYPAPPENYTLTKLVFFEDYKADPEHTSNKRFYITYDVYMKYNEDTPLKIDKLPGYTDHYFYRNFNN